MWTLGIRWKCTTRTSYSADINDPSSSRARPPSPRTHPSNVRDFSKLPHWPKASVPCSTSAVAATPAASRRARPIPAAELFCPTKQHASFEEQCKRSQTPEKHGAKSTRRRSGHEPFWAIYSKPHLGQRAVQWVSADCNVGPSRTRIRCLIGARIVVFWLMQVLEHETMNHFHRGR